jgi:DNA-directed RNA polymerase specialized sigma24 family protein
MSPLWLRRFRAERLLKRDFEGLRAKVLATVGARLAASGGELDRSDLEACYAQAWQGLYMATLDGEEIANPAGWLVIVTLRRAIEERRSRHHAAKVAATVIDECGVEPDLAARMDDLRKLHQVFEGLRERLNARECEAASLCYLQGLTRAEAAERMGITTNRMRKLMEGDGAARRGVSGKVGELLGVVHAGGWCEQHGSMMRALAFGALKPGGERHRIAVAHQRQCPACRRYVLSLRGLAAILPPLALPGGLGIGAGAGAGAGVGAGAGAGGGAGAAGGAGAGAGTSAVPSLAGALGVKLAGGLAALGVAVGGAALVARGGGSVPAANHPAAPTHPAAEPSPGAEVQRGGGPRGPDLLRSGHVLAAGAAGSADRHEPALGRIARVPTDPGGSAAAHETPRAKSPGTRRSSDAANAEFGIEGSASPASPGAAPGAQEASPASTPRVSATTASRPASQPHASSSSASPPGSSAFGLAGGAAQSASAQKAETGPAGSSSGAAAGDAERSRQSSASAGEEFSFE